MFTTSTAVHIPDGSRANSGGARISGYSGYPGAHGYAPPSQPAPDYILQPPPQPVPQLGLSQEQLASMNRQPVKPVSP